NVGGGGGGGARGARLWARGGAQPRLRARVLADTRDAYSVAFSSDGKFLAAAGADGVVRLYGLGGRRPEGPYELKGHPKVYPLAFSPDGKTLASADHAEEGQRNNTIRLWDVSADQPRQRGTL